VAIDGSVVDIHLVVVSSIHQGVAAFHDPRSTRQRLQDEKFGDCESYETASLSDAVESDPAPPDPNSRLAEQIEANFEAKRKELGVSDDLRDIPGLTTLMFVAFEQGIKTIDDLAG
jgi:hypothetical protein